MLAKNLMFSATAYLLWSGVMSAQSTFPQAIALLFVMRSVAAVVLSQRAREQTSVDVARSLRAIRLDVPIIPLCR